MDVPFELWGQRGWPGVDIVGESHYADAIRDVFGSEFREQGCELATSAQLVPEPWNRHDRNAVGVWVAGRQVGYLSREDAARYAPALSELVAEGRTPQVGARVWAAAGYADRPGITGSVRLDLAAPHLIVPANRPPGAAHRVLPVGNAIQVTGEEMHLDALRPWLRPEGECWVHVTLHEVREQLPRSTRELLEVRIDRAPVGRLTPKMSAELLPAVRHLAAAGHLTAARALVRGNRIKIEVVLHAARSHELPESWLVTSHPADVTAVAEDGAPAAAAHPTPAGEPGVVTVERPAGVARPVVIPGISGATPPPPGNGVVAPPPPPPPGRAPQSPPAAATAPDNPSRGAHAAETSPAVTVVLADPAAPAPGPAPQPGTEPDRPPEIPPRPAGIRFAVPPGWPDPPPGWSPPAGWRPDPAWPPAPPDWQWWVPFWA